MTPDRARPRLPSPPGGWAFRGSRIRRRLLAAVLAGAAAAGLPSPVVASSGGGRQITDAENTRTVYLVVTVLVLLAIGLAVFTWWFWRSTRREHEALAPLEMMGDRKFLAADTVARQVMLDGNRPVGAAPLAPGAPEPLMVAPAGDSEDEATPATLAVTTVDPAAAAASADVDSERTTAVPAEPLAVDGDATAAVPGATDATAAAAEEPSAGTVPAAESPAAATETVSETAAASETETAAAATETPRPAPAARLPIDPGLPVPPSEEEPPRHLSLAELAALHSEAPAGFDDDELASTPSTGIPVIESAEAWLQRQLAGGQDADAVDGSDGTRPDDPDDQHPAAVQGAD